MLYREGHIIDGDEIPVSFYEVLNRDCLFRLLLAHHHILRWMNSKITRLLNGIVSQHGSAGPSLARESWLKNVNQIVTCLCLLNEPDFISELSLSTFCYLKYRFGFRY